MCIFDVDDVNDVLDYFRDCEKTVKLERRCYPILKEHIGFGIFDVLEIRDEITKYSVYHIS